MNERERLLATKHAHELAVRSMRTGCAEAVVPGGRYSVDDSKVIEGLQGWLDNILFHRQCIIDIDAEIKALDDAEKAKREGR